jgi:hypothetical protein
VSNQATRLPMLTVANTAVRQGADGWYCLNDLHRASGGENHHRQSLWVENRQAQELIGEITKAGIPALASIKGGSQPGTYACRELVYASRCGSVTINPRNWWPSWKGVRKIPQAPLAKTLQICRASTPTQNCALQIWRASTPRRN